MWVGEVKWKVKSDAAVKVKIRTAFQQDKMVT
ncbi:hypothetical protein QG37_06454 [Candidozyma auris]|uniref:Uncharacterized protein n=1 Tax=Candidozyma auris TaxID=498019 RepID=A0A0L0NSU5_CANAR|nr:hypothetical protein QG37_06454 [[Candida] auris]